MTERQYNWRLLSESFDRELSDVERMHLESFLAEHEASREFDELLKRIRDCMIRQDSIAETNSSLNQQLSDQKKTEIQRLLELATKNQQ